MDWRLNGGELAARGDRIAVRSRDGAVTYAELAVGGASVWRALRRVGALPGDGVGLLSAAREHDEAVGLVGALAMGGVVVPLDPAAPPLRLAAMVSSAGCRAVIHDTAAEKLLTAVASELGAAMPGRVVLDGSGRVLATFDAGEACAEGERRHDLCAVLHTSGSTGVPKAVPITWEGMAAFTGWAAELLRLREGDRVLRVAEMGFDLAWFDHVATWRKGATLVTTSRRDLAAGRSLLDAVRALDPTVIYAVPSLYMKLVGAMTEGDTLGARALVFAGEPFPPRELARLAQKAPDAELWNFFGPTETNVCTFHRVEHVDVERPIPIGRACPYARCTLVDEDGNAIEGEGVGELVVEGPTTIGGGPYATRDRVERDAHGIFHFRGRMDRMVKVRGYRVEPGEVEHALSTHPAVRAAAVVVKDDARLGKVLQAFVVTHQAVGARDLRAHVAARLPPYMVPDEVSCVDELPLGATGKVDRSAL